MRKCQKFSVQSVNFYLYIQGDSDFTRITSGIDRTNRNNDSLYYKPYSKNASAWSKMAPKFELSCPRHAAN